MGCGQEGRNSQALVSAGAIAASWPPSKQALAWPPAAPGDTFWCLEPSYPQLHPHATTLSRASPILGSVAWVGFTGGYNHSARRPGPCRAQPTPRVTCGGGEGPLREGVASSEDPGAASPTAPHSLQGPCCPSALATFQACTFCLTHCQLCRDSRPEAGADPHGQPGTDQGYVRVFCRP